MKGLEMNFQHCLRMLIAALVSSTGAEGALSRIAINYAAGSTNLAILSWATVPGKSYFLLSTPALSQPWSALNPVPMLATTNRMVYGDSNVIGARLYRVVELAQTIQMIEIGVSEQDWPLNNGWDPPSQSSIVTGSNTLLALGAWWDANDRVTPPPIDNNGSFSLAVTPKIGYYPLEVQVAYQTNSAPGVHVVTPTTIGSSGDGYFLLAQMQGLAQGSPVRDAGYTTNSHTGYGPGDPNVILSATVTTDGSAAQVGDLAVAVFSQDDYEDNNQMSLPAGWTSLGVGNHAIDNICYRACYKIVSSPGRQSVTCSWVDSSCFVTAAAIVIFKQAGN
jgi:hypothetical protein